MTTEPAEPDDGERAASFEAAYRDPDDGSTPWPFLIALLVGVLVLVAIGLMTLFNRGADDDREAVIRAVLAQNDALQRQDYSGYRANTCAAEVGSEADVLERQRNSVAAKGERYVNNVTAVSVDGDRATATVSYFFAADRNHPIDGATTFVREDGSWRVCSPGPR